MPVYLPQTVSVAWLKVAMLSVLAASLAEELLAVEGMCAQCMAGCYKSQSVTSLSIWAETRWLLLEQTQHVGSAPSALPTPQTRLSPAPPSVRRGAEISRSISFRSLCPSPLPPNTHRHKGTTQKPYGERERGMAVNLKQEERQHS